MSYRAFAICITTSIMAFAVINAANAGPREDRRACWQAYKLCAIGAGDVESWRTVCYSDYTVCIQDPDLVECTSDDRAYCLSSKSQCESRYGGRDIGVSQCDADHSVCLDAHEC